MLQVIKMCLCMIYELFWRSCQNILGMIFQSQWGMLHGSHHWHYYHAVRSPLQWCHNECDGISNHQPHDCLLNHLFRCRSKKTSKLRVTGLCAGNSPVTNAFPAQMASNAENVFVWWHHHVSNSFENWATIDEIYKYLIFKWVTQAWLKDRATGPVFCLCLREQKSKIVLSWDNQVFCHCLNRMILDSSETVV